MNSRRADRARGRPLIAMGIRRRILPAIPALGALVFALALEPAPGAAQQPGPIQLFPELSRSEGPTLPRGGLVTPGTRRGAPTSGFQVEGLEALAIDAVGLEGGFGPDLWQGSDPELVWSLVANLPVVTRNPPLRDLTRRVLITGVDLPGGEDGRLLEARALRLVAMGDLASAGEILAQLPPTDRDSGLVRAAADVALLQGDDERACWRAQDVAPASAAAFWGKLRAYCRLRAEDIAGARLALDLLREGGAADDAAFFELAEVMATGAAPGGPPALAEPSPLHVAMLRAAGLALPEAALAAPSPPLLAAIMRTPALAPDASLDLAERAFMLGVLSGDELAARYLEAAQAEAGPDVLAAIASDWSAATRAQAWQRVREEQVAAARAEVLDALWLAARGPERLLIAHAFDDAFVELPLADGLLFMAPSAARALLAIGRPVPAARWLALLRSMGTSDGEARRAAAALAPLFALAGVGGGEVPRPTTPTLAAWEAATGAGRAEALLLLALLEGTGARVDPTVWGDLLEPPFQAEGRRPILPLWRVLETARADRRRGVAILSALHMLNGDPSAGGLEATVAGLQALRAAGLDREARAIAVASALMEGL